VTLKGEVGSGVGEWGSNVRAADFCGIERKKIIGVEIKIENLQ
jgi:hypothetical protein